METRKCILMEGTLGQIESKYLVSSLFCTNPRNGRTPITIHKPIISSLISYHRVCKKSITTGGTSGAETAYLSREPEFIPVFIGIRVAQSLVYFMCSVLQIIVCPFVLFWSLCCLSFDLRLLNAPLVSSDFSWSKFCGKKKKSVTYVWRISRSFHVKKSILQH